MEKTINDMSITELKAFAYDLIAQSQVTQRHLATVNQLIVQKMQETQNSQVVEESK